MKVIDKKKFDELKKQWPDAKDGLTLKEMCNMIDYCIELHDTSDQVQQRVSFPAHADLAECPVCNAPGRVDLILSSKIGFEDAIWFNSEIMAWECYECWLK